MYLQCTSKSNECSCYADNSKQAVRASHTEQLSIDDHKSAGKWLKGLQIPRMGGHFESERPRVLGPPVDFSRPPKIRVWSFLRPEYDL